jgi:type I restriction enzyme R subunit
MNEGTVESATLDWLAGLGYAVVQGPDIAPGEPGAERASYGDVVLVERLRAALVRLNSAVPPVALDEALRKVLRRDSPALLVNNRVFHRMLVEGVNVEMRRSDGSIAACRCGWSISRVSRRMTGWRSTSSR